MNIDFWAATDVGQQRDHNEDNFLVDKNLNLFVVADGMGGHAAGEVASSMCVRHVREVISEHADTIDNYRKGNSDREELLTLLQKAIQSACASIYQRAQDQPEKRGMGTTCSMLMVVGDRGFLGHVGDSRIYLLREGQVHQLSEDHSLINELIRRGKIKADEVESSPYKDYKNAVTRAVGVYESVEVDTLDFDILPGDRFLICSDGQSHYIEDDEAKMVAMLSSAEGAKAITAALIEHANAGGGHDNITSIVLDISDETTDDRAKEVSLKLELLKGMDLFRYLGYKELVRLLNITEVRDYPDDEVVVKEGERARELFIILDGKIRLHKDEAFITYLKRGDHFGEMGLVDGAPRNASGTAEGTTRVLVVPRREFYQIIRKETPLAVKILWSLVQVLTKRLRKTTEDLSGARLEAALPDLTDEVLFDDAETLPDTRLSAAEVAAAKARLERDDDIEPAIRRVPVDPQGGESEALAPEDQPTLQEIRRPTGPSLPADEASKKTEPPDDD